MHLASRSNGSGEEPILLDESPSGDQANGATHDCPLDMRHPGVQVGACRSSVESLERKSVSTYRASPSVLGELSS